MACVFPGRTLPARSSEAMTIPRAGASTRLDDSHYSRAVSKSAKFCDFADNLPMASWQHGIGNDHFFDDAYACAKFERRHHRIIWNPPRIAGLQGMPMLYRQAAVLLAAAAAAWRRHEKVCAKKERERRSHPFFGASGPSALARRDEPGGWVST